ncbi:MAG: YceI family protein [Pseudomonadota bacterium]
MKSLALAATASIALAIGTITAAPAILAQDAPEFPGTPDPDRVTAGTYALDPAHTLVSWGVDHFGFNDYFGLFGAITGTMEMDPENISDAEFEIKIPIANVTVANAGLKEHLLRPGKDGAAPDFFGSDPGMATFTSTKVTKLTALRAKVDGDLTMNGKTGPVSLAVTFTGAGTNPFSKQETVGFHARAKFDRTKWGLTYGQGLIGNDVDLTISAAFEKQ